MALITMLCRSFLISVLLIVARSNGQNVQELINERAKLVAVDWTLLAERLGDLAIMDSFPNQEILNRYQQSSASATNVSDKCLSSLKEYTTHLDEDSSYASEMDYSSGHLPNDFIKTLRNSWMLTFPGYFTQCRSVEVPLGLSFDSTQYCMTSTPFFISAVPLSINLGKCLPGSCSNEELHEVLKSHYPRISDLGVSIDCVDTPPFTTGAIIALVVSSLLLFLMLIATIYDYLLRYEKQKKSQVKPPQVNNGHVATKEGIENKAFEKPVDIDQDEKKEMENETKENIELKDVSPPPYQVNLAVVETQQTKERASHPGRLGKALLSFSVWSNSKKLLSTDQPGNLRALNGLRVLSMFWVILGHTLAFISLPYYENPKYVLEDVIMKFGFQIVWNGTFSVDTFFFLSGFLVAYLTLRELHKRNGSLNWFLFYFHRYWRLTPMFAFVILLFFLLPYFVTGPFSSYYHDPGFTYQCREYWWAGLLYFGNLYPFPGTMDMCVAWTWYLAIDFQCYIISPIFIILLYKNWKIGLPFTTLIMLCSMGVTAGVATYFGVFSGFDSSYYNDNLPYAGAEYIYNKPWTRLPVYLVGLLMGWFIHKYENEKLEVKPFLKKMGLPAGAKWLLVFGGWCCSTALALACLFGMWPTVVNASEGGEGNALSQWEAVLYLSVSRVAWAVSMAWISFACITGYGGPINRFLSWKFWIPMGRLTYGAYLIHPITLFIYSSSWDVQYYFEMYSYICLFLSQTVIAYVSAFFLSLAVESPMIGLEKILLGKK